MLVWHWTPSGRGAVFRPPEGMSRYNVWDSRFVKNTADPAVGDEVKLVSALGAGVWVAVWPDGRLKVLRNHLPSRIASEPMTGVLYARMNPPCRLDDAVLARMQGGIDRLSAAWSGGTVELETAISDTTYWDLTPSVGPVVAAHAASAHSILSLATKAKNSVKKLPRRVWSATEPFGNKWMRISALLLATAAMGKSGKTLAEKSGMGAVMAGLVTSVADSYSAGIEWIEEKKTEYEDTVRSVTDDLKDWWEWLPVVGAMLLLLII